DEHGRACRRRARLAYQLLRGVLEPYRFHVAVDARIRGDPAGGGGVDACRAKPSPRQRRPIDVVGRYGRTGAWPDFGTHSHDTRRILMSPTCTATSRWSLLPGMISAIRAVRFDRRLMRLNCSGGSGSGSPSVTLVHLSSTSTFASVIPRDVISTSVGSFVIAATGER